MAVKAARPRRDVAAVDAVRLALGAMLVLAAANFLWQIGSSSYFVDEVLSLDAATHALGGVLHAVVHTEITPPAYFLFAHEWVARAGSQAEWVTRLPSALGGVALVAAVYWLALLVSERTRVALGAAVLAALSPFVLEYAQRAQGYLLAALLVTVGVCAVLQAEGSAGRPKAWLVIGAVVSGIALATNYTAAIVVALECVWVASRTRFPVRWRRLFIGACALIQVLLMPLFVVQWHNTPGRKGVGGAADLTLGNAGRMARAAFDGRAGSLGALGIVVTLAALLVLMAERKRLGRRWRLIAAIAVGEPLLLLALSALGARVAITRYAAVAVPFLIVAIAGGISLMPRPLAVVAAAAACAVSVAGLIASHQTSSFYPATRAVVDYVQAHRHAGDVVVSPTSPGIAVPLAYYGLRRLRPVLSYVFSGTAEASATLAARRRMWTVLPLSNRPISPDALIGFERPLARRLGYEVVSARIFDSSAPLAVMAWAPSGAAAP